MPQAQREFISGMEYYVPCMSCGAELGQRREVLVDFGTPNASSSTNITNGGIDADAGATTTVALATPPTASARFGQNVQAAASGATGGDVIIEVHGRDYLGQAMVEQITVTNADGTSAVVGDKAFYWVDKLVHDGGAGNAVTISVGFGTKLGMPYASQVVEYTLRNQVETTSGTFVAFDATDPATATSGDPRGTYIPNAAANGADNIKVWAKVTDWVNDNDNGGLHGMPQYYGTQF